MNSLPLSRSLSADDITIAITVYDRRNYISQAIQSALEQTIPVKVIVVEDCGPDTGLKSFVQNKFGGRIQYFRNAQRRGLFDNWNACLELCTTPFLSILHDDDFLHPEFIAAMKELIGHVPNCGLYFGRANIVDENEKIIAPTFPPMDQAWRKVTLLDFTKLNLLMPGQLIRKTAATSLGGFRPTSLYCGDYEMWCKLTAEFGAAQTAQTVCSIRHHSDWGRGTSRVERSGKIRGLTFVQQKRIAAMLKAAGKRWEFDRKQLLSESPISSTFLIQNAALFSPRMLKYNYRLLLDSKPPNWRYALFRKMAGAFGRRFLKLISACYRILARIAFH